MEYTNDTSLAAIGIMSGTSLDGIDVALLKTDGCGMLKPGPWMSIAYSPSDRQTLRKAIGDIKLMDIAHIRKPEKWPSSVNDAESLITDRHIQAVKTFLCKNEILHGDVDVVGFHGQTVFHKPGEGITIQIGDGARLANEVAIPVVNDFRSQDVFAGGQGAPLAPLYHQAFLSSLSKDQVICGKGAKPPVCVLNIGGVANLTYINGSCPLIAFDTGPGNALLDDWMQTAVGEPMDKDGKVAAQGKANQAVVDSFLSSPWFKLSPPKSVDRLEFVEDLKVVAPGTFSVEDGAATLTSCTVGAINAAVQHLPVIPSTWIVCGGGQHNATMMNMLRRTLDTTVLAAKDIQWPGDEMEAQLFAWLAVRSLKQLPLSLPETTGVPTPMTGGKHHQPGLTYES